MRMCEAFFNPTCSPRNSNRHFRISSALRQVCQGLKEVRIFVRARTVMSRILLHVMSNTWHVFALFRMHEFIKITVTV